MRQVEVSRTLVLDDPPRARAFFEALVQDNVGIGRPEEISMVFARPLRRRPAIRTALVSSLPAPRSGSSSATSIPASSSTAKAGALRVETVINKPSDLDLPARLHHLPALVDKARAVNQRLLMIERAGQSCAIGSALYDAHPPALPPREPQNRLPRSNTYVLTDEGIRVAVVYTKLHNRLLKPLLDADKPPAPIDVRNALKTLESAVNQYVDNARLAPAS